MACLTPSPLDLVSHTHTTRAHVATQLEGGDETSCTFVLDGEDHTLGNSLRYVLMRRPEVDFCGYSIPHPSERQVNLRLQTRGTPAVDSLDAGLQDLSNMCEHVLEKFGEATAAFEAAGEKS